MREWVSQHTVIDMTIDRYAYIQARIWWTRHACSATLTTDLATTHGDDDIISNITATNTGRANKAIVVLRSFTSHVRTRIQRQIKELYVTSHRFQTSYKNIVLILNFLVSFLLERPESMTSHVAHISLILLLLLVFTGKSNAMMRLLTSKWLFSLYYTDWRLDRVTQFLVLWVTCVFIQ